MDTLVERLPGTEIRSAVSDMSDDESGVERLFAATPPTLQELHTQPWRVASPSVSSAAEDAALVGARQVLTDSQSSDPSVDRFGVSSGLSSHIDEKSIPKSYHSLQPDRMYDPKKGWKKSNYVPPDNPNFDEVGAQRKFVSGVKKNAALLNPLLDSANCDLLQPADINDIILDSFLPLADAFSTPMDRNRQGIVNRAISLARLYDPILVLGCEPIHWDFPALSYDLQSYLDEIAPQFRKGGAEARAAAAAFDYNWDTFPFPDGEALQGCHGNILELIRLRQEQSRPGRINLERISTHLPDYPKFQLLREVVVEGLRVFPDPQFVKNYYEKFRKQEMVLQGVICKHAMDSWKLNRCLIFRESDLSTEIMRQLNFNPSFWVFKWLDVFGRWCLDASNREDKRLSINGGEAKSWLVSIMER